MKIYLFTQQTQLLQHLYGINQRPPSTSQIIPNELSAQNTTNTTYVGINPLNFKSQNQQYLVNQKQNPKSALLGEENISNDESPNKYHSIKTYHISTFFNNGAQQQMKFSSYLSQQSQNLCAYQSRQQQQHVNPQTFNYDYLRTYPKMNFQLPEQKTHENISVSQYETPINQSMLMITLNGPLGSLIGDNTLNQQDMSILTNSCLNISQPAEIISIYGMNGGGITLKFSIYSHILFYHNANVEFGQNNQKRWQTFNKDQNSCQIFPITVSQQKKDDIQYDRSSVTLNNTTLNLTQPDIQLQASQKHEIKNQKLSSTQPIKPQGQHIKIQNCYSVSDNNNNMTNIDLSSNQDLQNATGLVSSRQNTQNVEINKQHLIQTFSALQILI